MFALFVSSILIYDGTANLPGPEVQRLEPLSEWVTNISNDTCTIGRRFGSGDESYLLELSNMDPWNGGFNVAIAGGTFDFRGSKFRAGWLPGGKFIEIDAPTIEVRPNGAKAIVFGHGLWDEAGLKLTGADKKLYFVNGGPEKFKAAVEGLSIVGEEGASLFFETGPMDQVIAERDRCMDEVLLARGVDLADARRPDHIVQMSDQRAMERYIFGNAPLIIRQRKMRTFVSFMMYLDSHAKPRHCRLITQPYDEAYERESCAILLANARFRFKKDEKARPTFFKISGFYQPEPTEPAKSRGMETER